VVRYVTGVIPEHQVSLLTGTTEESLRSFAALRMTKKDCALLEGDWHGTACPLLVIPMAILAANVPKKQRFQWNLCFFV